jgi:hypothetical protein
MAGFKSNSTFVNRCEAGKRVDNRTSETLSTVSSQHNLDHANMHKDFGALDSGKDSGAVVETARQAFRRWA